MKVEQHFVFPPFHLDPNSARLWRGRQEIRLRLKPFAVLRYLLEHSDRLVGEEEFAETVWAGVTVEVDAVLKSAIRDIRKALDDQKRPYRLIRGVRKRGYQFIGHVIRTDHPDEPLGGSSHVGRERIVSPAVSQPGMLVGREIELAQMQRWLAKAQQGERQVVFVTGELGAGKTTVVEAFQ